MIFTMNTLYGESLRGALSALTAFGIFTVYRFNVGFSKKKLKCSLRNFLQGTFFLEVGEEFNFFHNKNNIGHGHIIQQPKI